MRFSSLALGLTSRAWLLSLILVLLPTTWAVAEAPLLAPQLVIQSTSDTLQKTLQKPELKKDFVKATQAVDEIIKPSVDFEQVSILILGKYWKTATPDQRKRFKKEFRTLLVRTYTTAFTEYANWSIRYLPLKMSADEKKVVVRTQILQSGAQPVPVDYRMLASQGSWKVFDVLIDGISLIQNYRTSFTGELANKGNLDELINHLSKRNSTALKEPLDKNSKSRS
jgi:phospholipid transport system substrate-binding protein